MKRPARVELAIPGEHNALNALAAAAVGLSFYVPVSRICQALEAFRPASKRMEVKNVHGVIILNDAYNANPDSMLAALKTLAAAKVSGKRIAVLGDMRELGAAGIAEHEAIGKEAARLGIDYVLTFGELARGIHDAAGGRFAVHYEQKNMLAEYLAELVAPGDVVLIKGSRSMKLEDVATFLEERLASPVPMYA
jgi:UDP-N-acetylmuramoyl-tripeptide--D-alanyl-D-alanine ligase